MTNMRLVYLMGSGDGLTTFQHWVKGEDDPNVAHVTFSSQFLDICSEVCATALVISSHSRAGRAEHGSIAVEHRPELSLDGFRGLAYQRQKRVVANAVRAMIRSFRPDLVFTQADLPAYLLTPLARSGVKIIPVLHTRLWAESGRRTLVQRMDTWLEGRFFRTRAEAIMCVSDAIRGQVHVASGGRARPIIDFLPSFRREFFDPMYGVAPPRTPFTLVFIGRIEASKGVFDLVEIARLIRSRHHSDVRIEVCGTGSDLEEFKRRIDMASLESIVQVHGWCGHSKIRDIYRRSHAVIVPTRSECPEGFNMVVVEAVLAGKPVISSSVCPAIRYVQPAVAEARPDDVDGYAEAVSDMVRNRERYSRLREACMSAREPFLDGELGFSTALRRVLSCVRSGQDQQDSFIDPRHVPAGRLTYASGSVRDHDETVNRARLQGARSAMEAVSD